MPPASRNADWREALTALAALETGLLERFADGATSLDAAHAAGLDPRASRIVATALVGTGYLEASGGGVLRLTANGAALLDPASHGDSAGQLHLEARAMRSHLGLAEVLRQGRPLDDVSGGDAITRERFLRAMRQIAAPRAPGSVAALGAPWGERRLLDVGGAPGTYARAFSGAGWDVTVLDLPETLELGEADLRDAGVACVGGDATAEIPAGPWDVVYLGNVVHLFDRATAQALIARSAAALAPGGVLAVQEVLGDLSPQGPGFGVMMLLSTEGGESYPEADYREWMAAAGCPLERRVALDEGWHHLLIGRRAAR